MKYLKLIIVFILFFLMSCSDKSEVSNTKPDNFVEHTKTKHLGCFLDHGHKNLMYRGDSIYYEISNDTLILNVVMEKNCAACLTDSVNINSNNINIYITDSCFPAANCNCDFEFKYYFTNYGDQVLFSVYTNSKWEPEYVLWGNLTYP